MIADDGFAEVKALVIARTGHHYYIDKDAQLAERLAHRMKETGDTTIAAYRDRLRDPADAEWPYLESAVTINETFFFRFAEQFDALRTTILPAMLERNRDERRLRIWSVGCSTGAEAHSIAILLADLLGDAIADWRIALTGTDIDEAALTAARTADYSSWALRTMGEAERARLFDRTGDRYRLKDRYRGIARFERHNLLAMIDAAAPLGYSDYDLILCRNVLIYFAQDDATAIVGALAGRLASDGILLLGHAEPNPGFDAVADTAQVAGILTYRPRGSRPAPAAPPVELAPPPRPVAPPPRRVARKPEPAPIPVVARTPDAVTHYFAALDALASGDKDRAERAFRDALYLDRSFAMAHYQFGHYLLAQGRDPDGRRSLTNALRVASSLDPATELAEGDGMTAGAMTAAIRHAIGNPR
ncbi:CheR family methyltransferase [Sphingomonas hankookensis]|uniref:CheR family methyltransferase n=1 Tax=Sphingomonas hankookensis TaxID=563996 RepID=UPI001F575F94|nr:protein-glutamate O-methyltransferase CheR [Sphingomonas hankookensis]